MPGGDRTGPMGMGAMTGRGAGNCAGYGMPGYANPIPGRGLRMGRGRGGGRGGHGRRNMYYATGLPGWMRFGGYAAPYGYPTPNQRPDPNMEKQALKSQAETLQSELDSIKKRLNDIGTETAAQ